MTLFLLISVQEASALEVEGPWPLMVFEQFVEARTGWPTSYEAAIDDRGIPAKDFEVATPYAIECELPAERASRDATLASLQACVAAHNAAWSHRCRAHAVVERGAVLVVRATQAWIDGSCVELTKWPSEEPWVSLVRWPGFGVLEPSSPVPAPGASFVDTVVALDTESFHVASKRLGWAVGPVRYKGQIIYQFGVHEVGKWRAFGYAPDGPFNRVDYGPPAPVQLPPDIQAKIDATLEPGYVAPAPVYVDPYPASSVE